MIAFIVSSLCLLMTVTSYYATAPDFQNVTKLFLFFCKCDILGWCLVIGLWVVYGGTSSTLTPHISHLIYWHTQCHNVSAYRVPIVGIFSGVGGVLRMCVCVCCHPDTKKGNFHLIPTPWSASCFYNCFALAFLSGKVGIVESVIYK